MMVSHLMPPAPLFGGLPPEEAGSVGAGERCNAIACSVQKRRVHWPWGRRPTAYISLNVVDEVLLIGVLHPHSVARRPRMQNSPQIVPKSPPASTADFAVCSTYSSVSQQVQLNSALNHVPTVRQPV